MSLPPPRSPLAQRARALLAEGAQQAGHPEAARLLEPDCTDRLLSAPLGVAMVALLKAQAVAALDLLESLAASPAELADAKDRCAAAARLDLARPRLDSEPHRLTADEAYAWAGKLAEALLADRWGSPAVTMQPLDATGRPIGKPRNLSYLRDRLADVLAEIPAAPLPPAFGTPPDERLRQAADAVAATITEEGDAIHIGAGFWPAFRVLRAALDGPPVRPYQPEPERRVLPVPIVDDPLGSPAQPPPSWADLDAAATARAAHLLGQAAVLPPGPMRAALERQAASALASRGSSAHKERAMRRYLGGR